MNPVAHYRVKPSGGQTGLMRIGMVAAASGVSIETLRFYERRGLLAHPPDSRPDTANTPTTRSG
jgi:hypothetical protein